MLFGQYRRGEANDPDTYVAGAAAVLSDYPPETIRYVTDPRTGLATNPIDPQWTGLPDLAHIKAACEAHIGPINRAAARERQIAAQLAEREQYARPGVPAASRPAGTQAGRRIGFKEFLARGGTRPIGFFEDQVNLPPGCKPLRDLT